MRGFSSRQGLRSGGILYVFQAFQTTELAEKLHRSAPPLDCLIILHERKGKIKFHEGKIFFFLSCKRKIIWYNQDAGRTRATPHNSASRFGERFFVKSRFEKCRNPVCTRKGHAASVRLLRRQRLRNISSFSNRRIGGKDPSKRRRNCTVLPKIRRESIWNSSTRSVISRFRRRN